MVNTMRLNDFTCKNQEQAKTKRKSKPFRLTKIDKTASSRLGTLTRLSVLPQQTGNQQQNAQGRENFRRRHAPQDFCPTEPTALEAQQRRSAIRKDDEQSFLCVDVFSVKTHTFDTRHQ
jgi:hypothetical protein